LSKIAFYYIPKKRAEKGPKMGGGDMLEVSGLWTPKIKK